MKITSIVLATLFGVCVFVANGQEYKYETVPGDPLQARIYTLDNGLKVYLTVYKEEPSIQTFIAVKVGAKNDPKNNTGLAHYFEHLMFKGTEQFGTKDYAAEKLLLDQIESEFEIYRQADSATRVAVYKRIDSLSYEASKIAIPNEYDKLMSAIGSTGTNAYTGFDMTVYTENIPSNQIENWLKIQSDRFMNPVIRGFHTELETVYEEKNMSLTRDNRKVYETLLQSLFPNHPYGMQTVLGSQEDLKNPSITRIREYFNTYYVANNMAICMSGDFDPDETIRLIARYTQNFPVREIPKLDFKPEPDIKRPVFKTVMGNDAENITIGFRIPGAKDPDSDVLDLMSMLLYNGKAGLIDLNLLQNQLVLKANAYTSDMSDYGIFYLTGYPKEGQTLEQVKDLLLEQVNLIRKGRFDKNLIRSTIDNYRLNQIYQLQNNYGRADLFVSSFVNDIPWKDMVNELDRQSKLTSKDIIRCARKYFNDNYVVIYKKKGRDPNEKKIAKPTITPIIIDRDAQSDFMTRILETPVKPIDAVFLDYEKDMQIAELKPGIPFLYTRNKENEIFEMYYRFEMGNDNDKMLGAAFSYLKYLGTSKYTPEQIQMEFYKLACSFDVFSGNEYVYVIMNGLNNNMEKALILLEDLLNDPKVNELAYSNMISDIRKKREDAKLNQTAIFGRLRNYATWGPNSSVTNIPSTGELDQLKPDELIMRIKELHHYPHRVLYYGPLSMDEAAGVFSKHHHIASELKPLPPAIKFEQQATDQNKVLFVHYEAKQLYLSMISKGVPYDHSLFVPSSLYNEYFSGSTNAVVFQEMRESRGLAYSASAYYSQPSKPQWDYVLSTFIATQNDKMDDALNAFKSILNNMPESEKSFSLAKDQIINSIRKQRIRRASILFNYMSAEMFGWSYDKRKDLFEKIPGMTFEDIRQFQQEYIKDKKFTYCILGDENDLNFEQIEKYGQIEKLSLEDIFGY